MITSGHVIPRGKTNTRPTQLIQNEEKSMSDANSFDLVVGIGSSSEVTCIIDTGAAINMMAFKIY